MTYASIGILAALVLLIVNQDVLFVFKTRQEIPAAEAYRRFLFTVLAYYTTDLIWGFLDMGHLTTLLFADTTIYFAVMALAVLFWTQYVITYLEGNSGFGKALSYTGFVFFAIALVAIIVNAIHPFLFWFDEAGAYHPGLARHLVLLYQILMFLLTAVFSFYLTTHKGKGIYSKRHRTIGLFGIAMAVTLVMQLLFPLLPLYSVGYLLGTCLLHTFVIEDEKEAYRLQLEESLERETRAREELKSAWRLAYTDALTGVKSKLAYVEAEQEKDRQITEGSAPPFAVVVFDLNRLKDINDQFGHDVGDHYIIDASRIICDAFKHSPVFRVGGDEFAAILEGVDYENRESLMEAFHDRVERNLTQGDGVIVAGGISAFEPGRDQDTQDIFERADRAMYERKSKLKERTA